jgi:hypothetical protein
MRTVLFLAGCLLLLLSYNLSILFLSIKVPNYGYTPVFHDPGRSSLTL